MQLNINEVRIIGADWGGSPITKPTFPHRDGGFSFAVLLPFACNFILYSTRLKTAKYGAVFDGVYPASIES